MISRILIKKIKKHGFGQKDSFTVIDVAPKEYYKLVKIDKLYFTKIILGFNKVLENIKPHITLMKYYLMVLHVKQWLVMSLCFLLVI